MLVIAVCAVVALGATGDGVLLPAAELDDGWARTLRIVGALAALSGLTWLLVQRKWLRPTNRGGPDPTGVALRSAAVIMGTLALLSLLLPGGPAEDERADASHAERAVINPDAPGTDAPPSGGAPITEGQSPDEDPGELDFRVRPAEEEGVRWSDWSLLGKVTNILLLIFFIVLGVVSAAALLKRRHPVTPPLVPVAEEDARAALRTSLSEVAHDDGDPRRQITAAYGRLLDALAAAGATRQPHEAPHEHLNRALGPLGVRPEPMHRLTELYVAAQFSERDINDEHRAAAARALDVSLAELEETANRRGRGAGEPLAEETEA